VDDREGLWEEVVSRKRQTSRSPPPPPPPVLADLNGRCFNYYSDSHFDARCPHHGRCFRCHQLGHREEDCTLPRVLRRWLLGYVHIPPRPRGGGGVVRRRHLCRVGLPSLRPRLLFVRTRSGAIPPSTTIAASGPSPAAATTTLGFSPTAAATTSGFSPADTPATSGLSPASPAAGPNRSSTPSSRWAPSRCCWVAPSLGQEASGGRGSARPAS
jgi:hypothetical protein